MAASIDDVGRAPARKRLLDASTLSIPGALAFFPTGDEIEAVSGLAHTEGHVTSWSRPLIDAERPSPVFSPRRWLGGLTSPWRSGYVMATGGRVLASLFVALESLLVAFPWLRKRLRKAALASARISLTTS